MNSKRYNFVLYDETDIIKIVSAFQTNRGKNISQVEYAYILHNRDDKKPHYHLFVEFPSAVKIRDIERVLALVNVSPFSLSHERTNSNFLAYLTHNTPKDFGVKASYEFDEIVSNIEDLKSRWEEAVQNVNKPNRQQQKLNQFTAIMTNLYDIVENNTEITNISSLTKFLFENCLTNELQYVINKTYAIKSMFETQFKLNASYNASRSLKTENQLRLCELKREFDEAVKHSQKLDDMEEKIECLKN